MADLDEGEQRACDRIIQMWQDKGGDWLFGMEHSLCIDQIMAKLDDPPDESAEWKLRRNAIQSILTGRVQKRFMKIKLYFGGIRVKANAQARYVLADTAEEHYLLYTRYWRSVESKRDKLVDQRELVRKKKMELPETYSRQRKLLESAAKKRIDF